jgi:hypothetical protein
MVDDSIRIPWESVTKISRNWLYLLISYVLLFGVVYLACDGSDKGTSAHQIFDANLGKSAKETLAKIRQSFGEENMSHTRVFEWHAWFRADRKWRNR